MTGRPTSAAAATPPPNIGSALDRERARTRQLVKTLENDFERIATALEASENSRREAGERIESLQRALGRSLPEIPHEMPHEMPGRDEAQHLREEHALLTQQNRTLQLRLDGVDGDVARIELQCQKLAAELAAANASFYEQGDALWATETQLEEALDEKNGLTHQLECARASIESGAQAEVRVTELSRDVNRLDRECERLRAKIATLESDRSGLRGRIRSMQDEQRVLTMQAEESRCRYAAATVFSEWASHAASNEKHMLRGWAHTTAAAVGRVGSDLLGFEGWKDAVFGSRRDKNSGGRAPFTGDYEARRVCARSFIAGTEEGHSGITFLEIDRDDCPERGFLALARSRDGKWIRTPVCPSPADARVALGLANVATEDLLMTRVVSPVAPLVRVTVPVRENQPPPGGIRWASGAHGTSIGGASGRRRPFVRRGLSRDRFEGPMTSKRRRHVHRR